MKKQKISAETIIACLKRGEFLDGRKVQEVEWHKGETRLEIIYKTFSSSPEKNGKIHSRQAMLFGEKPKLLESKLVISKNIVSIHETILIQPPSVVLSPTDRLDGITERIIAIVESEIKKRPKTVAVKRKKAVTIQPQAAPAPTCVSTEHAQPKEVNEWIAYLLGKLLNQTSDDLPIDVRIALCWEDIIEKTEKLLRCNVISQGTVKKILGVENLPDYPKNVRYFIMTIRSLAQEALLPWEHLKE